jgi:hypothetical protein
MKRLTLMDALLLALALLFLLSFGGCATLPPEQRAEEAAYQSLHLVDTLQTLQIHNGYSSYEQSPVLGRHPSQTAIVAYMAAEAGLHAIVTEQLSERGAPIWVQRVWAGASIGFTALTVRHNMQTGIPLVLP